MPTRQKIFVVSWTESERGWGQRPDGYSIHKTAEDAAAYIRDYWKSMPKEVPDEYSRPDGPIGGGFRALELSVPANNSLVKELMNQGPRKHGMRIFRWSDDASAYRELEGLASRKGWGNGQVVSLEAPKKQAPRQQLRRPSGPRLG